MAQSRREFLHRTAVVGGVMWAAPAISSFTTAKAGAMSTGAGEDPARYLGDPSDPGVSGADEEKYSGWDERAGKSGGALAFTGTDIAELGAAAGAATALGAAAVRLGRREADAHEDDEEVEAPHYPRIDGPVRLEDGLPT